ncbi:MAG: LysM peptidoglycan-binding domain-containing protein [Chloroflexi bacterium]|nr:LysM peptidoglycan-binding domain-containing protein [Chloroflexota bacterium]
MLGLVAILLAAAALFFLPSLLGLFGGPSGSPTPGPSATPGPSVSAEPTIAPAATPQTYTVKSGDTLGAIAKRFGVTLQALQAANGITNPDKIAIGQVLIIPTATPTELPGVSTSP